MKNAAFYFFGASVFALAISLAYTTAKISSKIDDIKSVADRAPEIIEKVHALKADVAEMADKIKAAKASLPETGKSLGAAGANAIKSFSKHINQKDDDAPGNTTSPEN